MVSTKPANVLLDGVSHVSIVVFIMHAESS